MSESFKLIAGNSFPTVTAHLLDGTTADLSKPHGGAEWQILVVYRGKHCPLCMRYLNLLEAQLPALKELGVSVCAVSADNRAQLTQCMDTLSVSFPIAYGLTQQQMKQLGLYISSPRSEQETDHNFAEPAIFVVNEQGILQAVNISNAPYLRPELDVVVRGLKFIKKQNNYPIRGTVV